MLLLLILIAPFAGAVIVALGAPARATALISSALALIATLAALTFYNPAQPGFQQLLSIPISAEWGLSFTLGADGLSLVMILLATIVTLAAVWFAGKIDKHESAFYACLLLIGGGAIGAFASVDLFFFYAFHELALVPTFLLIGIWGTGNRAAAAWKITIYLAVGSFILLIGLIMLYQALPIGSRNFDIRALQAAAATGRLAPDAQSRIYLFLLLGFGILISLFPFHSWAPEAYAAAPSPAAMLHAGVLKKFGLYGLLRLAVPLLPEGARAWTSLLLTLLLGNIIYIGLVTIAQKKLDWMLGYSSVMHMGYIFLGIASANILGTTGAAILILAHGLSIALLFAVAGEIRRRTGTLDFADLGGLAKVMPYAGLAFGIGAFAAIGLPGLANFAGEVLIFFAAFRTGWEIERFHFFQLATVLALWGVVISTIYMLRAYRRVFMGALPPVWNELVDFRGLLRVGAGLLAAALLWFGFFPQSLVRLVTPAFQTYFTAKQ